MKQSDMTLLSSDLKGTTQTQVRNGVAVPSSSTTW